jgi:tetratricopeptide (TPR) repeat protein
LPYHTDDVESPAIRLFIAQSQRVGAPERLADELSHIARICQLVQGLPLGIELASAWAHLLPCAQIAHELGRSLDFLQSQADDVPVRQHSLRATFEYSWQRLRADEQRLFAQLAIFRGGFTLAAAAAVTGASPALLGALVDKALVQRAASGRYELHEVMRQFGAEQLAHTEAATTTPAAHATYFARWLEDLKAWMRDERRPQAFAQINAELANVYAMWTCVCERRDWENMQRATQPLYTFYDAAGYLLEGITALRLAEAAFDASTPAALRAHVVNRRGALQMKLGQLAEARLAFTLTLQNASDGTRELALEHASAQMQLGNVDFYLGRFADAQASYEAALATWRVLGESRRITGTLVGLAAAVAELDQTTQARAYYQEGIALARQTGNQSDLALLLDGLGLVEWSAGQLDEALRLQEEGLALSRANGNTGSELVSLINLSATHYWRGERGRAQQLAEELLPRVHALGSGNRYLVYLSKTLGVVYCELERFAEARELLHESLTAAQTVGSDTLCLLALAGMAHWLAANGQTREAVQLCEFVLQHPAVDRFARVDARHVLAALETQLDGEAREHAKRTASAMQLEPLIAKYLSV